MMTGLLFLSVILSLYVHSQADLIDQTCKDTKFPDLCISTLRSNSSSTAADASGLARIVFEAALSKATATLSQVKHLFNDTKDSVLKECFEYCISQYDDAVHLISHAIKNVGSNNSEADQSATGAVDLAGSCEDTFKEDPPRISPLTDANNAVINLVQVANGIVHILDGSV
ncbi:hypothetical protein NMG60_11032306 [Bertholletia excelsa]